MENSIMKKAKFIACPGFVPAKLDSPWGDGFFNNKSVDLPAQNNICSFVKEFSCREKPVSAVLRATALGVFDVYVNGVNADSENEYLKPGNTDCNHHLFVREWDVTELLGENNCLVAVVAPGWKSGRICFNYYADQATAFCGEIEITYADGSAEIIASDESFLATTDGSEKTADIWDGWYCDSRVAPVYADISGRNYTNATLYKDNTAELIPVIGAQVYDTHDDLKPVSSVIYCGTKDNGSDYGEIAVTQKKFSSDAQCVSLKKGSSVIFDMAQNMVGVPVVEVNAPENCEIKFYFAEMLNDSGMENRGNDGPKGSLYIKNYRSALARAVYISNGNKNQTIEPEHVFYGFRYIEITADADIEILSVTGRVLSSFKQQTGFFSCSDAEVNKLFNNVVWGAKGNYLSIPTDCPQRDERLGWTGDTQVFATAGSYLTDTKAFFEKWLNDARDSQKGFGGSYSCTVPRDWKNEGGNAAWADAGIIVPDVLYRMYGDREILRVHFNSMCDYMDYIYRKNGLDGPNTAYGDWLNYEHTDKRYIAVCYYAYDAALMVKFCDILTDYNPAEKALYEEKKAYFSDLRAKIEQHFLDKYFAEGDLIPDMRTQTTYLLALNFNLIPEQYREDCKLRLRKKITDNDYTLSTGFVGTGVLEQTLSKLGMHDLAYDLLLQGRDPSWLYSVRQGATTIWERWNSYTKEKGFGDVGMNSFNHYAYGVVAQWMFDGICGIKPDENEPGFEKTFILAPTPDLRDFIPAGQNRITHAEASYKTAHGTILSSWCLENSAPVYRFTVPEGLTARVGLLKKDKQSTVNINGLTISSDELCADYDGERLFFTLPAGNYTVK